MDMDIIGILQKHGGEMELDDLLRIAEVGEENTALGTVLRTVHLSDGNEVVVRMITRRSSGKAIMAELGKKAVISASSLDAFLTHEKGRRMRNQPIPEQFVFFLREEDGSLRTVYAGWLDKFRDWQMYKYVDTEPPAICAGFPETYGVVSQA